MNTLALRVAFNAKKLSLALVITSIFSPLVTLAQSSPIQLTGGGMSQYTIIIPAQATADETKASKVLQTYLQQISGVTLSIASDATVPKDKEILIGRNNRLDGLKANIRFQQLGQDGFTIKTIGNKIIMAGGPGRGNSYAAYSFLEGYLGCKKLTPDFSVIPHMAQITISPIKNDSQIPQFKLRSVNYYPCNNEYGDWNKIDELNRNPNWGSWVNAFTQLVPPSQYFNAHPEYFALYNGKRVPDQLCMTNEGVFQIVVQKLKEMMAQNPNAKYWTICQNDALAHCQCDNCKRLDQQYGSPQGSLLTMVNRIARQFPDKIIATHAYAYSLTPPTNGLKPDANVLIILSTINCGRTLPIQSDPQQGDFRKDISNWSHLTSNLYIWDYVVQFSNFLAPFPDIPTYGPNYRFFEQNNVSGVFAQASGYVPADLFELKSYLLAKLLWNPNCDINKIKQEFINDYYGAASQKISEYVDLREKALLSSNTALNIYGNISTESQNFLSPALLKKYSELFDEAESLAKNDSTKLAHVKISRLPVEYAIIKTVISTPSEKQALQQIGINADRNYDNFISDCKKYKIDQLSNFNGEYRVANLVKDYSAAK